jgi:hypothetical protein
VIFERKPKLTKSQMLDARPLRLSDAEPEEVSSDKFVLKVELQPTKVARWLLRMPRGATKSFELDPLGLFVYQACDGKTPVRQVIKKLAKRYNLNVREAEVATLQFLYTLARKGLIGMAMKK